MFHLSSAMEMRETSCVVVTEVGVPMYRSYVGIAFAQMQ
jgi:hypothetical protein